MSSDENGRLVGGVLRTAQGQSYGMKILHARIAQLNAINEAKSLFQSQGTPPSFASPFVGQEPTNALEQVPQVELAQLLQSINDSLSHNFYVSSGTEDSATRFTYQDTTRAFALIVRVATNGSAEDITSILEFINGSSSDDGIITKLNILVDNPPPDPSINLRVRNTLMSLKEFWDRLKVYLEKMLPLVGQPELNRANASKALIKSLKFSKLRSSGREKEFLEAVDAQQNLDNNGSQFPPQGNRSDEGDASSSSFSSGPGYPYRQRASEASSDYYQRMAEQGSQQSGHRSRGSRGSLIRREDSQHGYIGDGNQYFTPDERNTFAYNSGAFQTGGRDVGWNDGENQDTVAYGDVPLEVAQQGEEEEGALEEEGEAEGSQEGRPSGMRSSKNEYGDYDILTGRESSPQQSEAYETSEASPMSSPLITNRGQLPKSLDGYKQLAGQINTHYNNRLPDGKGPIRVGVGSLSSVRSNFIRRLNL
jgi:hypothetical protein